MEKRLSLYVGTTLEEIALEEQKRAAEKASRERESRLEVERGKWARQFFDRADKLLLHKGQTTLDRVKSPHLGGEEVTVGVHREIEPIELDMDGETVSLKVDEYKQDPRYFQPDDRIRIAANGKILFTIKLGSGYNWKGEKVSSVEMEIASSLLNVVEEGLTTRSASQATQV